MKAKLSEEECLERLGFHGRRPTTHEVRKRYLHLSKKNHPDYSTTPDEKQHAHEVFTQFNAVYQRLMEIRGEKAASSSGTNAGAGKSDEPLQDDRILPEVFLWKLRWWKFLWRHWRTSHQAGPPPRSSPDTRLLWPDLKSLHHRWLRDYLEESEEPKGIRLHSQDPDELTTVARDYVEGAKTMEFVEDREKKNLADQLYWAAEAEQNKNVCYLRFLKPILGDVSACAR